MSRSPESFGNRASSHDEMRDWTFEEAVQAFVGSEFPENPEELAALREEAAGFIDKFTHQPPGTTLQRWLEGHTQEDQNLK